MPDMRGMDGLPHRSISEGIFRDCPAPCFRWRRRRSSRTVNVRMITRVLVTSVAVVSAGCASMNGAPTPVDLDAAIRARTETAGLRLEGGAPLPPDVNLADGLTQEEAVAIALWNSPTFQATLVDLGIARADLAEAGLLRNPIFSLLFPLGPKQLEFTLQYPFDALVQRPARVAAARVNARAIGERLVWNALSLVAQVTDGACGRRHGGSTPGSGDRECGVGAAARRHYRRTASRRRYQRPGSAGAKNRRLAK